MKQKLFSALGILLIIIGVPVLVAGQINALFFILAGLIIIPVISRKIEPLYSGMAAKSSSMLPFKYFKILLPIPFVALGFLTANTDEINLDKVQSKSTAPKNEQKEPTLKTSADIEEVNKSRIINLDKVYYDANGSKVDADENDITYRVVEVLNHEKKEARQAKFNFENISLLVEVKGDYKDSQIAEVSKELKRTYAQFAHDRCNLDLWASKKAYNSYLSRENYIRETSDKLLKEFRRTRKPYGDKLEGLKRDYDKKNYPLIADNLIATSTLDGAFLYYPLKDSYYVELGGKNKKN